MISTNSTAARIDPVAFFRRELEDFYAVIQGAGFRDTEFSLQPLQSAQPDKTDAVTSDLVIVTCRRSGVKKVYASTPYAPWLGEFFNDLHSGVFDARSRR